MEYNNYGSYLGDLACFSSGIVGIATIVSCSEFHPCVDPVRDDDSHHSIPDSPDSSPVQQLRVVLRTTQRQTHRAEPRPFITTVIRQQLKLKNPRCEGILLQNVMCINILQYIECEGFACKTISYSYLALYENRSRLFSVS